MKVCSVCNSEKLLPEFSRIGKGRYASYCKSCRNAKARMKRATNPLERERAKERDRRWREKNPEAAKMSDLKKDRKYKEANREDLNRISREKMRAKRNADKLAYNENQRQYRTSNPDKFFQYYIRYEKQRSARRKLNYAVEKGHLIRAECCQCCLSEGPIQAHHVDYDEPLKVSWLCSECHGALHVRENEKRRKETSS